MPMFAGIVCSAIGAFVGFAFGLWTEALTLLLVVMAIDYATGVIAAVRDGSGLSSSVGFWGLLKKGLVLLVVLLAHRIDRLLGFDLVMGATVFFYIANELLSVLENYGRMGLPLPDRLRRVVQALKERADADAAIPDSELFKAVGYTGLPGDAAGPGPTGPERDNPSPNG